MADSDLRLNAWLRSDAPAEWSEASIVERGEELFEAAKEVWFRPVEIGGEVAVQDAPARAEWRFTDQTSLRAKKSALLAALAQREGVEFRSESNARFVGSDGRVRAAVTVSKRYEERGAFPYWYAYHPEWDEFLAAAALGLIVFGCMDKSVGFAVPREVLQPKLALLNTTVRRDSGKMHWHIHLVERARSFALLLPKVGDEFDLSPYLIEA